jgi:tetratricopeptide (TPR) repeat protein
MWFSIQSICIAVILLFATQVGAETQLFHGNIDVITGSGRLCEGFLGLHAISVVIDNGDKGSEVSGYFEGKGLTIGRFSGTDLARMTVIYPDYDEERATGHLLSLIRSHSLLEGELRDKHVDASSEGCSFDMARLNLKLVAEGEPAKNQLQKMTRLFDAHLANSKAHVLVSKGDYEKALPLFEKSLELANPDTDYNHFLLNSSMLGLASSYFRLGRFKEFNRIYDERFGTVTNEWVKSNLNGLRFVAQFHLGNEAVRRGEYDEALNILLPAYTLNMQNMEIIDSIITSYLRSRRFVEATSFLEQALAKLDREEDRRTVVGTIAMISFLRFKRDAKEGREIEAEADLRKAFSLNPNYAPFWVALARQRHKAGSFEEANTLLQEGLNHFKDEPSRKVIIVALEKMQQIEIILKSVR